MSTPLPERPWEVVAIDYFKRTEDGILLYSKVTIKYLKEIFAKFGILKVIGAITGQI